MLHPPTRQVRRRSTIAGTAAALLLAISPVAAIAAPATPAPATLAPARAATADPAPAPPVFGPDWDDPRTAARPIDRPDTESCTVRIVDNEFVNFDVYAAQYAPPAGCAGSWSMVVLDLHGSVAGRQFDRLGWLRVGGVPIFKTSTPEPSAAGIAWSVEKDVTEYAELLRDPQVVEMYLGNVVNETYTGVLDVTVDLTFYAADDEWPAASTPETVQPLADATGGDGATHGTLTVPANTERLLAQVYATGSGGGCEEFWYTAAPATSPDDYWCKAADGPWREVQVYVDGTLAGIGTPYPHVYTGGWSNPFLWYVLPAPRAFDVEPIEIDLTPFVGTLTDGLAHEVSVVVDGAEGVGWDVPTAFVSWQDEGSERVTGSLTRSTASTPSVTNTVGTDGDLFTADLAGTHALTTAGYVDTSCGRIATTVQRTVTQDAHHSWSDGEWDDGERLTLTDTGTIRTTGAGEAPPVQRWSYAYDLDGLVTVTEAGDITTTMSLADTGTRDAAGTPRVTWHDGYEGEATWNYLVPRDQRVSTGWSQHDYRTTVGWGAHADRYHHVIRTVNGVVTQDTAS